MIIANANVVPIELAWLLQVYQIERGVGAEVSVDISAIGERVCVYISF